jgi:hypothetical protein
MPLAGSMDIRSLLEDAPTVTLSDREQHFEDVDILQVLYEIGFADLESLVPPALNPTIPPVVTFLAYRAKTSEFGPFSLVQLRLSARSGVRPRAFLISAFCDNPAVSELLTGSWGYRIRTATIELRRFHDRVDCRVVVEKHPILEVGLVDPQPITGHDVQYPPGMHLARVQDDDGVRPRLIQVDTEYEFRRADRGRPELRTFDPAAWGNERLVPTEPISASFAACNLDIASVRYICNPDIPASEGTLKVGSA